jgi:endonuclease-3
VSPPTLTRIKQIFERFKENNPSPKSDLIACNDFTFIISVLLSAQATDKAVNSATKDLFKVADTPRKMLSIGVDELVRYIRTIGLCNNKAKNIIALSEVLVSRYDSGIPTTRDELERLPGIGRKSANVIANCLFGEPFIAVDTHVMRLAGRLGLSSSKTPLAIEADLIKIIPEKFHVNASNWLVLHGRHICTARAPQCARCFLKDLCTWTVASTLA